MAFTDTSIKFYYSTMTGAPQCNGQNSGPLIALLDACLKDGFGLSSVDSIVVSAGVATVNIAAGHSMKKYTVALMAGAGVSALNGEKRVQSVTTTTFTFDATGVADGTYTGSITTKVAPAGWLKPFSSGSTLAAYQSGNVNSTKAYFRIDETNLWTYNSIYATILGAMTMSEINTYRETFTPPNPYIYKSRAPIQAATHPWFIIASDKFVYLGIAYYDASYPTAGYGLAYFGDYPSRKAADAFNAIIRGISTGINPAPAQIEGLISSSANSYCALAKSYTGLGSGIAGFNLAHSFGVAVQNSGAGALAYPNGPDFSILLDRVYVCELVSSMYHIRGTLPGAFYSPQYMSAFYNTSGQAYFEPMVIEGSVDYPNKVFLAVPLSTTSNCGPTFFDISGAWGL